MTVSKEKYKVQGSNYCDAKSVDDPFDHLEFYGHSGKSGEQDVECDVLHKTFVEKRILENGLSVKNMTVTKYP